MKKSNAPAGARTPFQKWVDKYQGLFYLIPCGFAARLWAAKLDFTLENFTEFIQTHCKNRAILYGKLRVPLFQGGV